MLSFDAWSMTGTIIDSGSAPAPILRAFVFSTTRFVNSSMTLPTTIARDVAVHFWPEYFMAPETVISAACSRSASGRTITGFLPPISSWYRLPRFADSDAMFIPMRVEPVNDIAATLSFVISSFPTVPPDPVMRLNTPAGRSTASHIRAMRVATPGVAEAGLRTIVFP